jgi:hypothetical protein
MPRTSDVAVLVSLAIDYKLKILADTFSPAILWSASGFLATGHSFE